jgi:glutamine synthetase
MSTNPYLKTAEMLFTILGGPWSYRKSLISYIAGIMAHAKSFTAITNPTVNSYKRLCRVTKLPAILPGPEGIEVP